MWSYAQFKVQTVDADSPGSHLKVTIYQPPCSSPGPRDADRRIHELIQEPHVVSRRHTVRAQLATMKVHRVC